MEKIDIMTAPTLVTSLLVFFLTIVENSSLIFLFPPKTKNIAVLRMSGSFSQTIPFVMGRQMGSITFPFCQVFTDHTKTGKEKTSVRYVAFVT